MFNFLKKFFKEEKEKKILSFVEFEEWFSSLAKKAEEGVMEKIKDFNLRTEEAIKKTQEALEKLENAELKNPDMPERAKQILEGNRRSHISKIRNFIEDIKLPKNREDIFQLKDIFEKKLEDLTKSTQRSYIVLGEFLANESKEVAGTVNRIRQLLDDIIREIKETNVLLIEDVRELIKEIKNSDKLKKDMEKNTEEMKNSEKKIKQMVEEMNSKIRKLRNDKQFQDFKVFLDKKDRVEKKKRELEQEFLHIFSIIEKSLRKFQHITLEEELVKRYIENPVKSILEDENLKLKGILEKMKEAILKESIQLKESKKRKTVHAIEIITEEFLSRFRNEHKKINKEVKNIKEKLKNISIIDEIEKLEQEKKNLEIKVENLIENIKNQKDKVRNVDKRYIIDKIVEKLRKSGFYITIQ